MKNGTYLLQLVAEPSSFHKVLIAHWVVLRNQNKSLTSGTLI
jgi:hypothetical protein